MEYNISKKSIFPPQKIFSVVFVTTLKIDAAGDLLSQYKYADKIYTTRLHCLLPARAMGLDVEFITADGKDCYRTKDLLEGSKEKEELKEKFYEVIGQ